MESNIKLMVARPVIATKQRTWSKKSEEKQVIGRKRIRNRDRLT
jgi:hypothetical protein